MSRAALLEQEPAPLQGCEPGVLGLTAPLLRKGSCGAELLQVLGTPARPWLDPQALPSSCPARLSPCCCGAVCPGP